MEAALFGYADIVLVLVAFKADASIQNDFGVTAADMACWFRSDYDYDYYGDYYDYGDDCPYDCIISILAGGR